MHKPLSKSGPSAFRRCVGVLAVAVAAGAGAFASLPASAQAGTASHLAAASSKYAFSTLDDQNDPTFNQLLGINSHNVISGYFGSGVTGHPNQGYVINAPYGQANYVDENFPNSAQTQVTGLNNLGDTSGFWVDNNGTNHGFVEWNGVFQSFNNPKTPPGKGSVNQLLGVNNSGVAVGFYNDAKGHSHAYEVNQATSVFTAINVPGAVSATATGINNNGDIVGIATDASKVTSSWLMHNGHLTTYQFPGGSDTQAFGVNDKDQIVGSYLDGSGTMHGFVLSSPLGTSHWQPVDDPNGVGSTVVNGINDAGDLVGFYNDSAGNTHGMMAMPNKAYLQLQAMPSGTVSFGTDSSGNLTATVNAFGLTPGSTHTVRLLSGSTVLTQFSNLTANGVGQASATLDSTFSGSAPNGSDLVVLMGHNGSPGVSSEIIGETPDLGEGGATGTLPLTGIEFSPQGTGFGIPAGSASVAYSPSAKTLTVNVTASGVTPGFHAAHIHLGSCQSQGPVQYMLFDLTANSSGQIVNQNRTIHGVTSGIPATGWYLNLHQGTSNNILKNGKPTIFFRPLLCANL